MSGGDATVTIKKLTVLPSGSAGNDASFARKAIATAEQLRAATGIDIPAITQRLAGPSKSE